MRAAGLGGLIALVAIGVVLAVSQADGATPAQRTEALAAELRCPDCQGLSVADSQTAAAREIRRQIDGMVAAGASDEEVRAHFTARYGDWILLAPSSPVVWLIPFAAVLAGLVALAAWLVRHRAGPGVAPARLTDQQRRRLNDEVEALDA